MLMSGIHTSPHAESTMRPSAAIPLQALTFGRPALHEGSGAARPPLQRSDFIRKRLNVLLTAACLGAARVNLRPKRGTNRRRITDRQSFLFRSLPDVVPPTAYPQRIHRVFQANRTGVESGVNLSSRSGTPAAEADPWDEAEGGAASGRAIVPASAVDISITALVPSFALHHAASDKTDRFRSTYLLP